MAIRNKIRMLLASNTENVGIARVTAAAFAAQINLTLSVIEEIKVAVSEAVSNAVIHGYEGGEGEIDFGMTLWDDKIEYVIQDFGKGIADIDQARQPAYSTHPERMGLGFVFMESFMDKLEVDSAVGKGTTIRMTKYIEPNAAH